MSRICPKKTKKAEHITCPLLPWSPIPSTTLANCSCIRYLTSSLLHTHIPGSETSCLPSIVATLLPSTGSQTTSAKTHYLNNTDISFIKKSHWPHLRNLSSEDHHMTEQ